MTYYKAENWETENGGYWSFKGFFPTYAEANAEAKRHNKGRILQVTKTETGAYEKHMKLS